MNEGVLSIVSEIETEACAAFLDGYTFLDEYCSTAQGLLDWFEVDLGFTELLFIQIDLCVLRSRLKHVRYYFSCNTYIAFHVHKTNETAVFCRRTQIHKCASNLSVFG